MTQPTSIRIYDVGTSAEVQIVGKTVELISDAGGPIDEILNGIRVDRPLHKIAATALRRWLHGYDGDPGPDGNAVHVEVSRGDEIYNLAPPQTIRYED